MKSFFVFFAMLILSLLFSCSSAKNYLPPCIVKDENGKDIRKFYGYKFDLVDSTGLYVYTKMEYRSPFGSGTRLDHIFRRKVAVGYFSQTRCGDIYLLDYINIKSLYKSSLPEFVKEVKEQDDKDLILPLDSNSNIPRINVILKKYMK